VLSINACRQTLVQDADANVHANDSIKLTALFNNRKLNKDSADLYLVEAQKIAGKSARNEALYLGFLGKELIMSGQLDSANFIADKGLAIDLAYKWRALKGKFYNIKGNVSGFKKNVYQSIDYYLQAAKIYESAGDSASLAGIYSNIANAYFSLKDYPGARRYATLAYNLVTQRQGV